MYQEFDITSAIAPEAPRNSVNLQGVSKVKTIYNSSSRSTEEFIVAAVADMGAADQNIMYANSTLNALSDRLATAGKIAKAVNTAKAKGMEGFQSMEYLNPWTYAIEGSTGEFFSKIWQAICTACRKIISMIANFIKWLGNVIASADTKAQIKDYMTYVTLKGVKNKEVDSKKINSLDWKVDGKGMLDVATSAAAHYVSMFSGNAKDIKVLSNLSTTDIAASQAKEGVIAAVARCFNCEAKFEAVKSHVQKMTADINDDLKGGINKVFKVSGDEKVNAKSLVMAATTKTGKIGPMSCAEIKKLSNDFSILKDGVFSKQIKTCVAAVSKAQREFANYTKTIDQLAKKFKPVDGSSAKDGVASMSKLVSELANARVRASSYYTGLMLEIQAQALRFAKTAHIALKQYIVAAKPTKAPKAEKGSEAYSVESLFNFN